MLAHHQPICPICQTIVAKNDGLCPNCDSPLDGLWAVGWREGVLADLIKSYKYHSVRANGPILADLLHQTLPDSLTNIVIVPLPTIGKHIRHRGLDHTRLLAKHLARLRGWRVEPLLGRATDTVQVGTNARDRERQAASTYTLLRPLDPSANYLLLDDIWTTGASICSAAKILRAAGATHLYAAVLAVGKPKPETAPPATA